MKTITLILLVGLSIPAFAQTTRIDDTSSVDKIVNALYDIISGPAGQRDWNRFKNLFESTGSLGTMFRNEQGLNVYNKYTPADYIANNDAFFLQHDISEKEIARSENKFENVAQVFSSYEIVTGNESKRGVNTFLLFQFNNRWYIGSVVWKDEPIIDIPMEIEETRIGATEPVGQQEAKRK